MKSILTTVMPSLDPKQRDRTNIGDICHGTNIKWEVRNVTVDIISSNPYVEAGKRTGSKTTTGNCK